MNYRHILIVVLLVFLVSCSVFRRDGGYYQQDGPPSVDKSSRNVADAVPKLEPPSKTGNKPYRALGKTYSPLASANGFRQKGVASWYGRQFHGRRTSSGERYDMHKMTAAHPILPLPSYVKVRNLDNNRTVVVRVNDRGPFLKGRIIDLSYAAASKLGIIGKGVGRVEIEALNPQKSRHRKVAASAPVTTANQTQVNKVYLQAGAFSNIENAEFLKRRLLTGGMENVVIMPVEYNGVTVYRVRVGPLASLAHADDQLPRLRDLISADPQLIVD